MLKCHITGNHMSRLISLCFRKAEVLARLCECAGLSESSLFADAISTKISCACQQVNKMPTLNWRPNCSTVIQDLKTLIKQIYTAFGNKVTAHKKLNDKIVLGTLGNKVKPHRS